MRLPTADPMSLPPLLRTGSGSQLPPLMMDSPLRRSFGGARSPRNSGDASSDGPSALVAPSAILRSRSDSGGRGGGSFLRLGEPERSGVELANVDEELSSDAVRDRSSTSDSCVSTLAELPSCGPSLDQLLNEGGGDDDDERVWRRTSLHFRSSRSQRNSLASQHSSSVSSRSSRSSCRYQAMDMGDQGTGLSSHEADL
jgi:hypothetical protein